MKVYQYVFEDGDQITMPEGAKILSVGVQFVTFVLWAEVDPDAPKTKRLFRVIGTGHAVPESIIGFLGTVFMGEYVLHVYEVPL